MSGIRVTPEQLAGLSSRVSSGSSSIEGELRALAGSLAPLGSDCWGEEGDECGRQKGELELHGNRLRSQEARNPERAKSRNKMFR